MSVVLKDKHRLPIFHGRYILGWIVILVLVFVFLEKKAMGTARFGTYPVWCAIRYSSCDAKSWMLRRVWGGGGGGDRAA